MRMFCVFTLVYMLGGDSCQEGKSAKTQKKNTAIGLAVEDQRNEDLGKCRTKQNDWIRRNGGVAGEGMPKCAGDKK